MAILEVTNDEVLGIKKELDKDSLDVILDTIQVGMYSQPVRSFVRETISNALDSVTEREVFRSIESGSPVSDFYEERNTDGVLHSSGYDKTYYDNKFLSTKNQIIVTYRDDSPRDVISIKDEGVGLGKDRIRNYFNIGWSSKRNAKTLTGRYGFGSKSGIATGVDYFIVHTVYNGFKTSFMVLAKDYEPITLKHPKGKTEVWDVIMADGSRNDKSVYWEPTDEYNSVTIELEVKKHNRQEYISAVRDQFQYFDGRIVLNEENSNGDITSSIVLEDDPYYESDTILIPRYSTYYNPHIILDGLNYGVILWGELELEERSGSIAIKVSGNDVDITQSREQLRWTSKTKKAIIKAIKIAEKEASRYVTEKLTVSDNRNLFEVNTALDKLSNWDSAGSIFARFLNIGDLKPDYVIKSEALGTINTTLDIELFSAMFAEFAVKSVTTSLVRGKIKTNTRDIYSFKAFRGKTIVFGKASTLGPKRAGHILKEKKVDSLIYIRPKAVQEVISQTIAGTVRNPEDVFDFTVDILTEFSDIYLDEYSVNYSEDKEDTEAEIVDGEGTEYIDYAAERRRNKAVLYTIFDVGMTNYHRGVELYRRQVKNTVKITDIQNDFANGKYVFVTSKYRKLGMLLEWMEKMYPKDLTICFVAENTLKHFLPYGTFITDYFNKVNPETGEIMIGEHIKNYNTQRKLSELYHKYSSFSDNEELVKALIKSEGFYEDLNKRKLSDITTAIKEYTGISSEEMDDIVNYLKTLEEFHRVVLTGNKKDIADKALSLFSTDKVLTIDAFDSGLVIPLEEEFKRISVIEPVLESISSIYISTIEEDEENLSKGLVSETLITQLNEFINFKTL